METNDTNKTQEPGQPVEAGGYRSQPDGIIELDSDRGKLIGFTSDKFDGYLWKSGDYIIICFIISIVKGNFRTLIETILSNGLGVKVPTPFGRMRDILNRNNYKMTIEECDLMGSVEIWTLEAMH